MYIATTAHPDFNARRRQTKGEPEELVALISQRVGRCLERQSWVRRTSGTVRL